MNHFFAIVAIVGAVVFIGGLLFLLVAGAFDLSLDLMDYGMRGFVIGFVVFVLAGIGCLLAEQSRPMSRGIVADKRHESTTIMVMSGKVLVPVHTETWNLISTEGARCAVEATSYAAYRPGDAVVCGWR